MIFLFTKHFEPTTDNVIAYLLRDKYNFVRFNEEEGIEDIRVSFSSDKVKLKLNNIELSDNDVYWIYQYNLTDTGKSLIESKEIVILRDYLLNRISINDKALGSSLADIYHNKLLDLELARQCGMDIPESHLISSIDEWYSLNSNDTSWIVKPMSDYFTILGEDNRIFLIDIYKVNSDDIIHFKEDFFPSFFQQFIVKTFEIRAIVINENVYAIAYFIDKQESISFKYSNDKEIPRMIPFDVPAYLVELMMKYMRTRNLNFASFDFIYSQRTDKIYFIECNPVGQIDWVSKAGNYYIEKEIAKVLCHEK